MIQLLFNISHNVTYCRLTLSVYEFLFIRRMTYIGKRAIVVKWSGRINFLFEETCGNDNEHNAGLSNE